MKSNRDIRRESFARLFQGRWFIRLVFIMLFFGVLQHGVGGMLDAAFEHFGLQTWFEFLQAKMQAAQQGLAYDVPSRAVALQMYQATAFALFISLIFAGMAYLGLATVNIKAAKDDAQAWCRASFGALANPLGCAALAFSFALRLIAWSLLLIVPGIVASYRYSQIWNVKAEHPDWGVSRCFAESARLMNGRKWQRFRLDVSLVAPLFLFFLGMSVLAPFAGRWAVGLMPLAGVGVLFVSLWMMLARAVFYGAAKEAAAAVGDDSSADANGEASA